MNKLLKVAGVTAGKQASGIKVDEFGRIELSRTVEPKRIIGNVLEPYAEDYKGPVSVFGLELYAVNSEYLHKGGVNQTRATPDGWLMSTYGSLFRYDSKGAVIWEAEKRVGKVNPWRESIAAYLDGHVYSITRLGPTGGFSYVIDKISYKTGKIVTEGPTLETGTGGLRRVPDLVYAASINRLVGVIERSDLKLGLIYVHPETLAVEYSVATFTSKIASVFGVVAINSGIYAAYDNGNIYVLVDNKGVATAKLDAAIEVTTQNLVKKFDNIATVGAGLVLNGDVYAEGIGMAAGRPIYRNGEVIYTLESSKIVNSFRGGTAGNLALMADGNKVLAFDKDNLVMAVEIPHEISIMSIAGDSMGNIFVSTDAGIYILGDTLQIKGYQLVG